MAIVRATRACGTSLEAEAGAEETAAIAGKTIQMLLEVLHLEVVRIYLRNRV